MLSAADGWMFLRWRWVCRASSLGGAVGSMFSELELPRCGFWPAIPELVKVLAGF